MVSPLRSSMSICAAALLLSLACVDPESGAADEGDGLGDVDSTADDGLGEDSSAATDSSVGDTTGDTGDQGCNGASPYMGGWEIGCCQDEVVSSPWYPGGVMAGTVIPDWTFTDQFGDAVRVRDFCHEAIYFDYAAMWCSSCQAHASEVASLYNTYFEQGLMTITYMSESADGGPTTQADVQAWATNFKQHGLVVYSTLQDVWFPFGVDQGGGSYSISLPGTMLLGPGGVIAKIGVPTIQEVELVLPPA